MSLARRALPFVLLAGLTLLVFQGTLGAEFVNWDDPDYVFKNEALLGLSWPHVAEIFSRPYFANYIPLSLVSYALDHSLWGGASSFGYHLTNLVLHTLNVLLALAWLRAIRVSNLVAFTAALVFAVHPVQVESVAWVSERKNLLSMFFLLLCFLAMERRDRAQAGARAGWTFIGALACAASLLSKPAAVVIPVLLALRLYALRGERRWRAYLHLVPFALLALASMVATVAAHRFGGSLNELETLPYGVIHLSMCVAAVRYLKILLFPVSLNHLYYLEARRTLLDPAVLAGLLLVVGALALTLWALRRRPGTGFWLAWPLVGLLPVSNIIPIGIFVADRYLYLPLLGVGVLAARGWAHLRSGGVARARAATGAGVLVILCLALGAADRVPVWHDSLTLWRTGVAREPLSAVGRSSLANTLSELGRYDEAIEVYGQALALRRTPVTYLNLGFTLIRAGRPAEGLEALRRGVDLRPPPPPERAAPGQRAHYGQAYVYLGVHRLNEGDAQGALADLRRAQAYGGPPFETAYNLGLALRALGRHGEALEAFETAVRLAPDRFEGYEGLGLARLAVDDRRGALEAFQHALGLARGESAARLAETLRALEASP